MRLLGAPAIPAPGLHPFLNQLLRRFIGDIGGSHWRQFSRGFGAEATASFFSRGFGAE
jgi:hypothetical protein